MMRGRALADAAYPGLWQQFAISMARDATTLEQLLQTVEAGSPSAADLERLRHLAHRLVGRLGMFGFTGACVHAEAFRDTVTLAGGSRALVVPSGKVLLAALGELRI